jgi:hypothetical protein
MVPEQHPGPPEERADTERDAMSFSLECVGSLLPGFLHNMGNTLVSAMGNFDLAVSSLADSDLSNGMERIRTLGGAIDRLGELHNRLGNFCGYSDGESAFGPSCPILGVIDVFHACCGRTLDLEFDSGAKGLLSRSVSIGPVDGAVLFGVLTAAFHAVRRNGVIALSSPDSQIAESSDLNAPEICVEWIVRTHADGGAEEAMPYVDYCLSSAARLAESSGCELRVVERFAGRGLVKLRLPSGSVRK